MTRRVFILVAVAAALAIAGLVMAGCQPSGSVLRGRLTLPSGDPAAGVAVAVHANTSDTVVATTATDAAGDYWFIPTTLPEGTYRVSFGPTQWWSGADSWANADPVTVSVASPATLDATVVPRSGSVSGVVSDLKGPLDGMTVTAVSLEAKSDVASTTSAADGSYAFGALPVGSYVFRFESRGHAPVYNGGAYSQSDAPPIEVTEGGAVTGVDATVSPSTAMIGTVTDGFGPLGGIMVMAHNASSGKIDKLAVSEADGSFRIERLDSSAHTVSLVDPSGQMRLRVVGSTSTDPTSGTAFVPTDRLTNVGAVALAPTTKPSAPRNVEWYSPFSSVEVRWNLPVDDGGRPITGYVVTALEVTPREDCTPTPWDNCLEPSGQGGECIADADDYSCEFRGLHDRHGILYSFVVRAQNANGTGPPSEATLPSQLSIGFTCGGSYPVADPDTSLRNRVLEGARFSNCDFHDFDLSGSDFTAASFYNVDLSGADLSGATLTGVASAGIIGVPSQLPTGWKVIAGYLIGPGSRPDFSYAPRGDFTGADFSGVGLDAVDLSSAVLTGVTSGGITGTPAGLPEGWILANGHFVGPGVNVDGVDLHGAPLAGVRSGGITGTPLRMPDGWVLRNGYLFGPGTDLRGADLSGMHLAGSGGAGPLNLSGANFADANLTGTTFESGVLLTGARSGGIIGTPGSLPTGWRLINGFLVGPGADLTGADLHESDLSDLDLTNAIFTGSNLDLAELDNTVLTGVRSGGITGTPFLPPFRRLSNGYLLAPGVDLTNANLTGANFEGVDLSSAVLTGARSGGITGTPRFMPAGWLLSHGYLFGPGSDLTGADLEGADLRGFDLTGVRSGGITGTPSKLPPGYILVGGFLIGPSVDLTGADLRGFDLTGANLTGATLTGVRSGNISGAPAAVPLGWRFASGYLVGPGADLPGAILSGADLTGVDLTDTDLSGAVLIAADLSGADLEGTDLTLALLTGVRSAGITGTPAVLPYGYVIMNGYLMGPGVDLSGADLSGLDLSNLDLTSVDLSNATLHGTRISGTDFTGANLTGVVSSNLSGRPEELPDGWSIVDGVLVQG